MQRLTFAPDTSVTIPGKGKFKLTFVADPPLPAASPAQAAVPVLGQPIVNTTGRLWLLHKQMSDIAYGITSDGHVSGSVAGYELQIQEAQAAGVDGFILDYGSDDPNYAGSLKNIYLAANAKNFKLYVKFDFSNPAIENTQAILSVLQRVLTDPANLKYNGQPVFSCYQGGGARSWDSLHAIFLPVLASLKAQGTVPFFVYGGEQTNPDGSLCDGSLASMTAWATGCVKPMAGAVCEFPGGDSPLGPYSGIPHKERLAQAVQAAGLLWQGAMNPQYGQVANSSVRYTSDFNGDEGIRAQYLSIAFGQGPLSQQVNWFEGATEDDRDEQSEWLSGPEYLTPPLSPWQGYKHYAVPGYYKSKAGLLAAFQYYLAHWKTGQWPSIQNFRAYATYCTQTGPCLAAPTNDPLGGILVMKNDTGDILTSTASLPIYLRVDAPASCVARVTVAPPPVAATHVNLAGWSQDGQWIYDSANPFNGSERGETLQITYGASWTPGNYTVDLCQNIDVTGQQGYQQCVHLTALPTPNNGYTGGQGTLYAANATLPALPPAPLITAKFCAPGQTFLRMPALAGNVTVDILQNGAVILTMTGEPIVGTAEVANANNYTMWAHN